MRALLVCMPHILIVHRMTQMKCQNVPSGTFPKGKHPTQCTLEHIHFVLYIYSVEESGWSTAGLRTESVTRDGNTVTVVCSSTHLTSFAVLVDVGGAKVCQQ